MLFQEAHLKQGYRGNSLAVQWKPTGLSTHTVTAGGSGPSHKWHRVAVTPPKTKKMPKDAEKVESERMGRVMLDNNNEKKLLLLIPEKK